MSAGVLPMGCDYPIQASEYVLMARKLRPFYYYDEKQTPEPQPGQEGCEI